MRPRVLISLILSFTIFINFETLNIDALPTNTGITTNERESLLSCFMRCSELTPEEPIREKRQVQRVVNQIVSGWKLTQTKSILLAQDCKAQELDEKTLKCYINDCQQGHKDNKLFQKVIDSFQAAQNVSTEICSDKNSKQAQKKLRCLVNSKSAIDDVISGLKCNEAVENFRNDGVSEQSNNKFIISGQSLCELIFCPSEAAKDYVEDSCKDFVYDILRKMGDLFYYSFAFGFEEAKNLVRFRYDDSTRGTHTGEKCADLALNL